MLKKQNNFDLKKVVVVEFKNKTINNDNTVSYQFKKNARIYACLIIDNKAISIKDRKIYEIISNNGECIIDGDFQLDIPYVIKTEKLNLTLKERIILYNDIKKTLLYFLEVRRLEKQKKIINFIEYKRKVNQK